MRGKKRNPLVFARMPEKDIDLIRKVCEARGEDLSCFVRRAVRRELARLSFLSDMEKKALEVAKG
jgi:hypothetical protein